MKKERFGGDVNRGGVPEIYWGMYGGSSGTYGGTGSVYSLQVAERICGHCKSVYVEDKFYKGVCGQCGAPDGRLIDG